MDVDSPSYAHRVDEGVYDNVIHQLMDLPKGVYLGDATYRHTFKRDIDAHTSNFSYKCRDSPAEYETVLIGEILPRACGTKFSAIGNHYVGAGMTPNVINDKARVKGIFVLGKPSQATEMMYITFENQVATLDDIIRTGLKELRKKEKEVMIKEWTTHAGTDTSDIPEYIMVHTGQLYAVSTSIKPFFGHSNGSKILKGAQQTTQGKCAKITKRTLVKAGEDSEGKSTESLTTRDTHEAVVTTNSFHEPNILPDYHGDLFQHEDAKLHQLDIRDVNNDLITPSNWYSELRQGTLVMIRAMLHAFNYKTRRVYQLNAHTIHVLDHSEVSVEPLCNQSTATELDGLSERSVASAAMEGMRLGKRGRED
ncbi:hypothetical protein DFH29DRAFT_819128 [Suillus ampliporus]|nr:hypothetical protein DFH29DRAFT_819128 [Suillus ampliporus]